MKPKYMLCWRRKQLFTVLLGVDCKRDAPMDKKRLPPAKLRNPRGSGRRRASDLGIRHGPHDTEAIASVRLRSSSVILAAYRTD